MTSMAERIDSSKSATGSRKILKVKHRIPKDSPRQNVMGDTQNCKKNLRVKEFVTDGRSDAMSTQRSGNFNNSSNTHSNSNGNALLTHPVVSQPTLSESMQPSPRARGTTNYDHQPVLPLNEQGSNDLRHNESLRSFSKSSKHGNSETGALDVYKAVNNIPVERTVKSGNITMAANKKNPKDSSNYANQANSSRNSPVSKIQHNYPPLSSGVEGARKDQHSRDRTASNFPNNVNKQRQIGEMELSSEFLLLLEENKIFALKKKNLKFPKAKFFCRLCDYHLDLQEDCDKHIKDSRHCRRKEINEVDALLRTLTKPTENQFAALTAAVENIYEKHGINESELKERASVVTRLEKYLKQHIPEVVMFMYGTSLTGFGLKTADVNVDLACDDKNKKLTSLLKEVYQLLNAQADSEFSNVRPDFAAKVPGLLITDNLTGLTVNVAIHCYHAHCSSELLSIYAGFDIRVKKLAVAFRYWAHVCWLDRQHDGFIPPQALNIMVIYFLQTITPQVVPIIKPPRISADEVGDYNKDSANFEKMRVKVIGANMSSRNTLSTGELWWRLLKFYCLEFDTSNVVVSIRSSEGVSRHMKPWNSKRLAVEDPYIVKKNITRMVNNSQVYEYWQDSIRRALYYFGVPRDLEGKTDTPIQDLKNIMRDSNRTPQPGHTPIQDLKNIMRDSNRTPQPGQNKHETIKNIGVNGIKEKVIVGGQNESFDSNKKIDEVKEDEDCNVPIVIAPNPLLSCRVPPPSRSGVHKMLEVDEKSKCGSQICGGESGPQPVADESVLQHVADESVSQPVADKSVPQHVADESMPQLIAVKGRPQLVADESVSQLVADESVSQLVADESVSQLVADESRPQLVADESVSQLVADESRPQLVADESVPQLVADESVPQLVADESVPQHVADESVPQLVADESVPQLVADESGPQHVADKGRPQHVVDKGRPQLVADESVSQLVADESVSQLVADESRPQLVADESVSQLVADESVSQLVADESVSQLIADESRPQLVADESVSQLVADESVPQLVADESVSQPVADESRPQLVADESGPQLVADEGRPQLVADEGRPQLVADEGRPQLVADESVSQLVADESVSQLVADESGPQLVADESVSQHVADESGPQLVADESGPQLVADESGPQLVADEGVSQLVADESVSQLVADESGPQLVADESVSQLVADDNVSQLVADESGPQLVADESRPQLVADESGPQLVADDNVSQLVADESGPQLVANEDRPQLVADESGPQLVADEGRTQLVADESVSQLADDNVPQLADGNVSQIVADESAPQLVADESELHDVADESGLQFVADEGGSQFVADESGLQFVADEGGSQFVADESGLQVVADENVSQLVDENVPQLVADENVSQLVDENVPQLVADENVSQLVADENVSQLVDENVPQLVADENVLQLVADKSVPLLLADENVPQIVADKSVPLLLADENVPQIVVDRSVPLLVAAENVTQIAAGESEPQLVADENGLQVVADESGLQVVADEGKPQEVADESGLQFVADEGEPQFVADESGLQVVDESDKLVLSGESELQVQSVEIAPHSTTHDRKHSCTESSHLCLKTQYSSGDLNVKDQSATAILTDSSDRAKATILLQATIPTDFDSLSKPASQPYHSNLSVSPETLDNHTTKVITLVDSVVYDDLLHTTNAAVSSQNEFDIHKFALNYAQSVLQKAVSNVYGRQFHSSDGENVEESRVKSNIDSLHCVRHCETVAQSDEVSISIESATPNKCSFKEGTSSCRLDNIIDVQLSSRPTDVNIQPVHYNELTDLSDQNFKSISGLSSKETTADASVSSGKEQIPKRQEVPQRQENLTERLEKISESQEVPEKLKNITEKPEVPRKQKEGSNGQEDIFSILAQHDCYYEFSEANLTNGKGPVLMCAYCDKEGHLKSACPENELPEILPLKKLTPHHVNVLSETLSKVPTEVGLSDESLLAREMFMKSLEEYIQVQINDAKLALFGSSCNGFGFDKSDMDICLTFTQRKVPADKGWLIEALAKRLRQHVELTNVQAIPTAKVPIVKFTVKKTNLDGDISLYNILAQQNTKLLLCYSKIDPRVCILGYAIKTFAKVCDIGDASRGSLSSYAYILMMLYYLQQVNPPVIPVLQELHKGKEKPKLIIEEWDAWFMDDLSQLDELWPEKGKNQSSVAELWLGFFCFYIEEFRMKEYVVSIRQKEPLTRFEKLWNGSCFAIEDPFDLNHNLGSGLTRKMHNFILKTFINGRILYGNSIDDDLQTFSKYQRASDYFFDADLLSQIRPPNVRGCRRCGKIGHLVRNCPLPYKDKDEEQKRLQQQQLSFQKVPSTSKGDQDRWQNGPAANINRNASTPISQGAVSNIANHPNLQRVVPATLRRGLNPTSPLLYNQQQQQHPQRMMLPYGSVRTTSSFLPQPSMFPAAPNRPNMNQFNYASPRSPQNMYYQPGYQHAPSSYGGWHQQNNNQRGPQAQHSPQYSGYGNNCYNVNNSQGMSPRSQNMYANTRGQSSDVGSGVPYRRK